MKNTRLYLLAILSFAVAFISCKDDEYDNKSPFDNVVYLDVAENSDTQVTTFKKTLTELKKEFSVVLSYPASQDVRVNVEVEPSLVDVYNARHNTSWRMLDSRYYTLSADKMTIPAGKTISDQLTLKLEDLDGSTGGEELPIVNASQFGNSLLSGETFVGHNLGRIVARQLDQLSDTRQGLGRQYAVQ